MKKKNCPCHQTRRDINTIKWEQGRKENLSDPCLRAAEKTREMEDGNNCSHNIFQNLTADVAERKNKKTGPVEPKERDESWFEECTGLRPCDNLN
jgi:hypothetical protein